MEWKLINFDYLYQCWNIVNWTLRNKLQCNDNQNSWIFIQENAFENVVWKMAAIFPWPQCIDIIVVNDPTVQGARALVLAVLT